MSSSPPSESPSNEIQLNQATLDAIIQGVVAQLQQPSGSLTESQRGGPDTSTSRGKSRLAVSEHFSELVPLHPGFRGCEYLEKRGVSLDGRRQ